MSWNQASAIYSYITSHFMFLQFGPKLSILMYERKRNSFMKSLPKVCRSLSVNFIYWWYQEDVIIPSPLDGMLSPSQLKGRLQVLLKGKTGCGFFGFVVVLILVFFVHGTDLMTTATNNWVFPAIKPSRIVSIRSSSLIF